MERGEISLHEVKVYLAFKAQPNAWLSNRQIADAAKGNARTVRAHTLKLVKLGLLDVAEVFPGHRYRLSEKAAKRNLAYVTRLDNAISVFGLAA